MSTMVRIVQKVECTVADLPPRVNEISRAFFTSRRTSRTSRACAIAPLLWSVCLLLPRSLHHVVFLPRTLENSHICERERETEEQRQHQGRRRGHPTGSNTEHPTAVNQSTVNCKVEENRSETSISSIFAAFANDVELGDVTNMLPGGL